MQFDSNTDGRKPAGSLSKIMKNLLLRMGKIPGTDPDSDVKVGTDTANRIRKDMGIEPEDNSL